MMLDNWGLVQMSWTGTVALPICDNMSESPDMELLPFGRSPLDYAGNLKKEKKSLRRYAS